MIDVSGSSLPVAAKFSPIQMMKGPQIDDFRHPGHQWGDFSRRRRGLKAGTTFLLDAEADAIDDLPPGHRDGGAQSIDGRTTVQMTRRRALDPHERGIDRDAERREADAQSRSELGRDGCRIIDLEA